MSQIGIRIVPKSLVRLYPHRFQDGVLRSINKIFKGVTDIPRNSLPQSAEQLIMRKDEAELRKRRMSQTTLNLVAISIFLMTLSVLLGPFLNLSPAVPALATFTILGIATFDSFRLQGKGGTIFLDWIAGFSSLHRDRIVHHEAGHFLVAYLFDIPISGYTLSAWEAWKQGQPGLGGVTFHDDQLASQLAAGKISAQTLDQYCTIWMAGIAAETLVFHNTEGGTDDQNKLAGVLTNLGFSASACQQKQRFHTLQAKTLLQENWSSYEALVKAMRERTSVADCQSLIKSSEC